MLWKLGAQNLLVLLDSAFGNPLQLILFSEGTVGEWKAFALSKLLGSPDNMLGGKSDPTCVLRTGL